MWSNVWLKNSKYRRAIGSIT
ncbi:unnamed protein product, partial [Rotaria magnacalcarata]